MSRAAELSRNLAATRNRIAAACAAAGRIPPRSRSSRSPRRIPPPTCWPGRPWLTDFGENRDQEAAPKAAEVAAAGQPVTWHFVGQLQTNKAHSVARYADLVHSVDRIRLVRALGAAARAAARELTCLVQVSLDTAGRDRARRARGAACRQPCSPRWRTAIEAEEGLPLGGLMAVAPRFAAPGARSRRSAGLSDVIKSVNASATVVSAGMSGDLEAAIECGATHLRIGTALLGDRRPTVL